MNKDALFQQLTNLIVDKNYPCIGAQKVLKDNNLGIYKCSRSLTDPEAGEVVCNKLYDWMSAKDYSSYTTWPYMSFASCAILFENTEYHQEDELESDLWVLLKNIHKHDRKYYQWDKEFSPYVYDVGFAMSVGGFGHFIPLLSPIASSLSRRFSYTALIFNPHFVFKNLRQANLFHQWKKVIRDRERKLQDGWISPKLGDIGESYEAPQYALTINPKFDIGPCPFTGLKRPSDFSDYDF